MKDFALFNAIFVIPIGGIAFYIELTERGLLEGLENFFWVQLFFALFISAFAGAATLGFLAHLPTIIASRNELRVRFGTQGNYSCLLSDIEWWHGDRSRMNLSEKVMSPGGQAVLLLCPPEGTKQTKIVAVGYDDQMYNIWTQFLQLAGLDRRADLEIEKNTSRKFIDAILISSILIGAVGYSFGLVFLSNAIVEILTGNVELAHLISIQFFLPGVIYLLVYCILIFPAPNFSSNKFIRSQKDSKKLFRDTFICMLLATAVVPISLLCSSDHALGNRIAASGFWLVYAPLVSWDLAKRLSKRT